MKVFIKESKFARDGKITTVRINTSGLNKRNLTSYFSLDKYNELMELDNERPMRCRFCLRHFKYDHSLVMHLKENHLIKILQFKNYSESIGSDKSSVDSSSWDRRPDRPSVIISNPYYKSRHWEKSALPFEIPLHSKKICQIKVTHAQFNLLAPLKTGFSSHTHVFE